MGLIRKLPPQLVNRIAAGECVERPASVVKELVENAFDAGAGRVEVKIEEGGRSLIEVLDDGQGMTAEDLRMSVEPHATSKIRDDADLFNIHTMGFRGEALASIGSVARLAITTRRRDDDVGQRIEVDGGAISEILPVGAPPGTCVQVRDLFFNVPARRKFLRTNQTEMGHISEQFARLALPNAGIAMHLSHQGRVMQRLQPTGERRVRIRELFGPELAEVLLDVHRVGTNVELSGLVAPPAQSRGSTKWEYVFVNGRFVRDRFISHAIKEAYRSLIDPSRYPVVFLFVTVPPDDVDVNVHPTKIEVRWRDSNYVHGQVLAALRDLFLTTKLDTRLRTPDSDDGYRDRVRAAMVDFFTQTKPPTGAPPLLYPAGSGRGGGGPPRDESSSAIFGPRPDAPAAAPSPPSESAHSAAFDPPPDSARRTPVDADGVWAGGNDHPAPSPSRVARRVIQVHDAFIVAETDDGLMIIDQHALHERILYEELRGRIAERPLESQRLLLPDVVRVPPDRIEVLETQAETLARLGVELTASGPQTVTLHAFPSLLERVDRVAFVQDLLDRLSEKGARTTTETLVHELLDMMACKAAVKMGDPLTADEIDALLARREVAERSSHCPHGRPTTLRLSLRDLERQFQRR